MTVGRATDGVLAAEAGRGGVFGDDADAEETETMGRPERAVRAVFDDEEVDAGAETREASGRPTARAEADDNGDGDNADAAAEAVSTFEGAASAGETRGVSASRTRSTSESAESSEKDGPVAESTTTPSF